MGPKVTPVRLKERRAGNASWPRPQEGTAGSSHTRQLYSEEEEPEWRSSSATPHLHVWNRDCPPPHTCGPSVSSGDSIDSTGSDGCEHAGMMRQFQRKTTAATSSARMIKWNLKSTDPQKSVPLLTHIWNFLFPQLNYIVINFVNNNYIFHYRIARKGRCKTLSQDSPLSCLCLFVYSIKY